jgi:5-methylcytosine-specific restriction endonuclease McrA
MADVIYKRCYFDWGGRCAYCDVGLSRQKTGGKIKASIDHFIPLAKGGQNGRSNRVLSCYPCNLAKGDIDPRETNQWPDVERRLAEIAASPLISHGKLKQLIPDLVKQIGVEA